MAIYLPLAIASVLFYGLMLLCGLLEKKDAKEPYDLLSYFPYELFEDSRKPLTTFARLFEVASHLAFLAGYVYFLTTLNSEGWNVLSFPLTVAVIACLSSILAILLAVVPAGYPKEHLTLYFVATAGRLLTAAMTGIYFLNVWRLSDGTNNALLLAFAILLFVVALGDFLLLLNPKLVRWYEMKKVANEDGSIKLIRPRPFVLAFSEWLVSLGYLLSAVLILIGFLFL
jgi:hypothetical protein